MRILLLSVGSIAQSGHLLSGKFRRGAAPHVRSRGFAFPVGNRAYFRIGFVCMAFDEHATGC